MGNCKVEVKKGQYHLVNRLTASETVNEPICQAINNGALQGFLPISVCSKRKETYMDCSLAGRVPLSQFFAGVVSENAFLNVVLQLVRLTRNCERNAVGAENIEWQLDRIFIDPVTGAVSCIYWPIENNQNAVQPQQFFAQLPYQLVFNAREERDYLNTYVGFFKGKEPYSGAAFEDLLLSLLGMKPAQTPAPAPAPTPEPTPAPAPAPAPEPVLQARTSVFCWQCGEKNPIGARFCFICGAPLHEDAETPAPEVLPAETPVSEVLQEEVTGTQATLTRLSTGERIFLDKPEFRIGKEKALCDYCVTNNNAVSRVHAIVLSRSGRYYLVDQHSTNKTYIDGQIIPYDTEVEIFSGNVIRLANEAFSFCAE